MKHTFTRPKLLISIFSAFFIIILPFQISFAQAALFSWNSDTWFEWRLSDHSLPNNDRFDWTTTDWSSSWQNWQNDRLEDWSFTLNDWNWQNNWVWDDWDHTPEPVPEDDSDNEVPAACMLSRYELAAITNFPPFTEPIVAFGDSLTAGVGASSGQDYVSELEELADVSIINAGISRDTTADALNRLEEDVLSYDPSTVIVWLGGNDILQRYYAALYEEAGSSDFIDEVLEILIDIFGTPPDPNEVISEQETFQNIETIVEEIQDSGAVVILVGIDGGEFNENLSDQYEEVAEDTGAIYVADVLDDILGRPSLTSDLIHPNNTGYEIVAERIYPALACTL